MAAPLPATRLVAGGQTIPNVPSPLRFLLSHTREGEWIISRHAPPSASNPMDSNSSLALDQGGIEVEAIPGLPEPHCTKLDSPEGHVLAAIIDVRVVEAWLYYLRRSGRISLEGGPASETPQAIPPHLSLVHARALDQPGTWQVEKAILHQRGIRSAADLLRLAPATSIAGIATRIGKTTDLLRWLPARPLEYWLDLATPLYLPIVPLTDGAHAFAIAVRNPGDGYLWLPGAVIQEHYQVHVSSAGQLSAQTRPIDAFGFEPGLPGFLPPSQLDEACRVEPEHSALDALDGLRGIVATILSNLLSNSPTGVYADMCSAVVAEPAGLADWVEEFMTPLQGDLFAIQQCLRWQVYPFDAEARPICMTNWLFADGDRTCQSRRRQALITMPHGVTALVMECQPDVLAAIDDARPLLEAIQKAYSVPAWTAHRAMAWRSTGSGKMLPGRYTTRRSPFSTAVHRAHALGCDAPELPSEFVGGIQYLVDWFNSDRRNFTPPARVARRMLRSLGRMAARSGWLPASRIVSRIMRSRLSLTLLDSIATATVSAYLRENVSEEAPTEADIVDAWLESLDAKGWLRWSERLAKLHWTPASPSLTHALKMAAREHQAEIDLDTTLPSESTTSLFFPFSYLESRVSIRPITTLAALDSQASRMENCLAAHWRGVRNYDELIVALEAQDSGLCASAALTIGEEDAWRVAQIRGPGNSTVEEGSPLNMAVNLLVQWMTSDPITLDQVGLEAFKRRRSEVTQPIDIEAYLELEIQRLPLSLGAQVLACLPGSGGLERRIKHAMRRAQRQHGN